MIRTVKFTECLETTLRVQNFGGKFQGGIIGRICQLGQLTVLLEKHLKDPHHQRYVRRKQGDRG